MNGKRTGILIVNLGTPDAPTRSAVYRYLKEFLTDRRVITEPWLKRQLLVRGIIAPFRSGPSSKIYQQVWTEDGSPLKIYGYNLVEKLASRFNDEVHVELAMRYQQPSIETALQKLLQANVDRIVIFPLFPQYASATTGSIYEKVMKILEKEWTIPELHFIQSYPTNKEMIRLFAENGREHFELEDYDHFLFSFHGLPVSQIYDADRYNYCRADGICCKELNQKNKFCYSAQSYATAQSIADVLNLSEEDYTVCFQSRLGRAEWLQPYTSDVLETRYEKGDRKILTFCPAFVADCLETTIEIGVEYEEEFTEMGGETLDLVPSLNDKDEWADAIVNIIKERVPNI
jgi:ferrochelatase